MANDSGTTDATDGMTPRATAPVTTPPQVGDAAAAVEPPVFAVGSNRLRLDGMLRELGAYDDEDAEADVVAAASAKAAAANAATAAALISPVTPRTRPMRPESITVGELVDKAAQSGFGFLIAVLSLIAIPFVGLSTPFGLAIALIGIQLLIGMKHPWLPQRARRRALKMSMLDRILGLVTRRMKWLASSTRQRWAPLVTPRLVGLGVLILALGLALPLPIPGSNLVFLIPLLIYAVGLLERDGLWILVGHVGTLINIGLLFAFGATVVALLSHCWHYVF